MFIDESFARAPMSACTSGRRFVSTEYARSDAPVAAPVFTNSISSSSAVHRQSIGGPSVVHQQFIGSSSQISVSTRAQVALYAMTLLPPLLVAESDPSLFFTALDNAGERSMSPTPNPYFIYAMAV